MRIILRGKSNGNWSRYWRTFWDGYFAVLCLLVFALWGLAGCSKDNNASSDEELLCDCSEVPADQHGSCLAPLRQRPSQIRIVNSDWGSSLSTIQSALAEWNQAATGQRNVSNGANPRFTLFAVNELGPYRVDVNNPRNCENLPYGTDVIPVEVMDAVSWQKMGLSENTPAITLRCSQKYTLMSQRILVHRNHLGTPQLQSILLHEFGHLIGLDHSCQEGAGTANYIGCSQVNSADHQYRQAVMFPTLQVVRTGAGASDYRYEKKEALTQNDLVRASCVQRR